MTVLAGIAGRFSVRSMLVAVMVLALQVTGPWAGGLGATGDCRSELHLSQLTDHGGDTDVEGAGIGKLHEASCTSICCNAACGMAVLPFPATVPLPAPVPGPRCASVVDGAEGIDMKGLSRPPRTDPSVQAGNGRTNAATKRVASSL